MENRKELTAEQAYEKTKSLLKSYEEGECLGGNPMCWMEKFAKDYSSLEVSRALEKQKREIEKLKSELDDADIIAGRILSGKGRIYISKCEAEIQTLREACIEMMKAFNCAPHEWIMTAEEFIREKSFPSKGITNENWEKFKHEHSGTNWVGFAIKAMEEYANHFKSSPPKLQMPTEEEIKTFIEMYVKSFTGFKITDVEMKQFGEKLTNFILSSLIPCSKTSEWISVEDRLPEVGKIVLFSNKNEMTSKLETRVGGMYNDKSWWAKDAFEDEILTVSSWQPLPEAPKQ